MKVLIPVNRTKVQRICDLAVEGLLVEEERHKQWYLQQILLELGITKEELERKGNFFESGIAP